MGHSYTSNHIHCVFSTKDRRAIIKPEQQEKLWAYLLGIARNLGIESLAIGGTGDHVHVLVAIPAAASVAELMSKLKANSSRWMREHGTDFSWQEGYGAFSVGASQIGMVKNYIHHQAEHHKTRSFEEEFIALLQKYDVRYDPKYMFG